ncbi:hypothetical protein BBJ28_00018939 [Nothophytophthora sp. Chile5]|nr:hypothetical protein BBJ28_00018939 [Nothophytophthora sp. Chile5]
MFREPISIVLVLFRSGVAAVCFTYIYAFVEETSHIKTAPAKTPLAADQKGLLAEGQDDVDEEYGVPRQTTEL